jgi:hypothetical protein
MRAIVQQPEQLIVPPILSEVIEPRSPVISKIPSRILVSSIFYGISHEYAVVEIV